MRCNHSNIPMGTYFCPDCGKRTDAPFSSVRALLLSLLAPAVVVAVGVYAIVDAFRS